MNPLPENLFQSVRITTDQMYAAMHKDNPLAAEQGLMDFRALDRKPLLDVYKRQSKYATDAKRNSAPPE